MIISQKTTKDNTKKKNNWQNKKLMVLSLNVSKIFKKMSNYGEKAYTDTKPNEVIDFSYAKFVNI